MSSITGIEHPESRILTIRGQRVIVDADLADLYGVTTKALNQAVKRNIKRFPSRYLFKLNKAEKQEVVTNCDHLARLKYAKKPPNVFTEHGAIMAATILNSDKAIEASHIVVEAFVRLCHVIDTNKSLAKKLDEFGARITIHDKAIAVLFNEIKKLAMPLDEEIKSKKKIGFKDANND